MGQIFVVVVAGGVVVASGVVVGGGAVVGVSLGLCVIGLSKDKRYTDARIEKTYK